MIITDLDQQEVTVGGAQEVNSFTIKASAKAFQILSSNLYSNPLGSMIRELSTNAYDAHIMAGKPEEPFDIKLPNPLDPTFKIRDYGPGLSDEEIHTVYTTFFESTKTNSNDVVGCLGLGSKSPFGVSDSFTITSYYNGMKTIYSAYLNDHRIPSIATFHSEATNEPNGIEIEVAIKEEDFSIFASEVNEQLKYFKVKPNVTGNSKFEWQQNEEYAYEGDHWKLVKGGRNRYARVLQGQIAYPINVRDMGSKYHDASDYIKEVFELNIIFEVNIGEVNIAPSREALSYDESTVENLIAHAQKIVDELPDMINKEIQNAATEWDARLKYAELIYAVVGGRYRSRLQEYLEDNGKFIWNGKDITGMELKIKKELIESMRYFDRTYGGNFRKHNIVPITDWSEPDDAKKTWRVSVRDSKEKILFYARPDYKSVDGRVKQYIKDNESKANPYIIETALPFNEMKELLGNPPIIDVATLDKVRRTPRSKKTSTDLKIRVFSKHGWTKSEMWDTYTLENTKIEDIEGFYLELDRFDFLYDGKKYESILTFYKAAKQLKLIDDSAQIYGLNKTQMKSSHNLVNFIDHCKNEYAANNTNKRYEFGSNEFISKLNNDQSVPEKVRKEIDSDSDMAELLDAIIHNNDTKLSYESELFIKTFGLHSNPIDMRELVEKCKTKYYMIKHMSYYIDANAVSKFINDIDKLEKCTNLEK